MDFAGGMEQLIWNHGIVTPAGTDMLQMGVESPYDDQAVKGVEQIASSLTVVN